MLGMAKVHTRAIVQVCLNYRMRSKRTWNATGIQCTCMCHYDGCGEEEKATIASDSSTATISDPEARCHGPVSHREGESPCGCYTRPLHEVAICLCGP